MFHTSSLNTFAPLMNTAAVRLTERCLTAPVMEDEGETGTTPSGQEVGTTNSDPASTGEVLPSCYPSCSTSMG